MLIQTLKTELNELKELAPIKNDIEDRSRNENISHLRENEELRERISDQAEQIEVIINSFLFASRLIFCWIGPNL
jgi:hypothetical protein